LAPNLGMPYHVFIREVTNMNGGTFSTGKAVPLF